MLGSVSSDSTKHNVLQYVVGEKHLSTREQFQLHTQESFIIEESLKTCAISEYCLGMEFDETVKASGTC